LGTFVETVIAVSRSTPCRVPENRKFTALAPVMSMRAQNRLLLPPELGPGPNALSVFVDVPPEDVHASILSEDEGSNSTQIPSSGSANVVIVSNEKPQRHTPP